jgi:hypothetical protein
VIHADQLVCERLEARRLFGEILILDPQNETARRAYRR